jgi:hypothetical protein
MSKAKGHTESKYPYTLPCSQPLCFIHGYHSLAKSNHCGFLDSIKAIFFARDHPFNCFSRAIAKCTSSKDAQ